MGRNVTCDACGADHLLLWVSMIYRCTVCAGEHYICGKCRWRLDMPLEEPPTCTPEFQVAAVLAGRVG